MPTRERQRKHGLNESDDPRRGLARDGPGPQQQEWPGSDDELTPEADHGEESYKGAEKLAGKIALITGGDSGIGRAIAIAYAREGADIVIAYYNEQDDAEETLRWVRAAGRKGIAIPGDLTDHEHCHEVVERTVAEFGRIDILVNNAAYQVEQKDFAKISPEQLDRTFRTNIYAYIWMAQAALPHLEAGSVIINTGSVTAMEGNQGLIDYSATKGAIHTFTKSLAQALSEKGIRVNCVAPGPVWTPLIPATLDEEHVARFGADTIWKRPAQPAEIAPSFVFLAVADSRYYTGEIFSPTGRVSSR
jgi:NAD(P)-dependent dehydrogenase (short-subunit alcohol dehydrogenase family)